MSEMVPATPDPGRPEWAQPPPVPLRVEIWMDYHCPYSHRVVAWLDDLGPTIVDVHYRFFALEQVNHDPDATAWRIWEQPLDYVQYRDRQHRRSLAAFLATAILEATEPDAVVRRFRRAVYAARFEAREDISDLAVLAAAADAAGGAHGALARGFGDASQVAAARARIAADWYAARAPWRIFGVPTLTLADAPPIYVRLAGLVAPKDGPRLLESILTFRAAAPGVLELKQPERVEPGQGVPGNP